MTNPNILYLLRDFNVKRFNKKVDDTPDVNSILLFNSKQKGHSNMFHLTRGYRKPKGVCCTPSNE